MIKGSQSLLEAKSRVLVLPFLDSFLLKKILVAGETDGMLLGIGTSFAGKISAKSCFQSLLSVYAISFNTATNVFVLTATAVLWLVL